MSQKTISISMYGRERTREAVRALADHEGLDISELTFRAYMIAYPKKFSALLKHFDAESEHESKRVDVDKLIQSA